MLGEKGSADSTSSEGAFAEMNLNELMNIALSGEGDYE
jgi:hypothetical protein